jgi:hypothetical protein
MNRLTEPDQSTVFSRKSSYLTINRPISVFPPLYQQFKSSEKIKNDSNDSDSKKRKVSYLDWLISDSTNKKPKL